MRTEDGRVVKAVAKEKETARQEHEQAIKQGKLTGLVEHVTDDGRRLSPTSLYSFNVLIAFIVFSLSLGALPGQQIITTKITVSTPYIA